ncbi:hypothetical protein R3P38DRAFT_2883270 [Favolaschia claudopus]|uniref:Uncharacterized protein n=1 Tax=Favolaschia claudopus TaxID=2862362 RepID=A0AAW0D2Z6_9AGAR
MDSAVSSNTDPALVRALPYITSALSALGSLTLSLLLTLYAALAFLANVIAHPIIFLSPFPLLLYLLAPLFIFIQLLLEVLVHAPYRATLYVADVVYPAYVFVGVACITGALVGLGGRLAVHGIVHLVMPPPMQDVVEHEEEVKVEERKRREVYW